MHFIINYIFGFKTIESYSFTLLNVIGYNVFHIFFRMNFKFNDSFMGFLLFLSTFMRNLNLNKNIIL